MPRQDAGLASRPRAVGGQTRFAGIDQGVDFTGPGPVYAVGTGEVTRIERSGSGWPGEGALLVYKIPGLQKFVYVAEDFAARAGLKVGSKVSKGDVIGQATGSGKAPGIEMGWADSAGHPVAALRPRGADYGDGPGRDFARFIGADKSRPRGSQTAGAYSYPSLVNLWVQSGGDVRLQDTMAAIALAESDGDPEATNVNLDGSVDRGLWQINSINFDSDTLLEARTNASWAVKVEKQQGLRAWTTYKTGAYKTYLQSGAADPSVVRTRPDGGGDGGGGGGALSWLGAAAGGPFTIAEKEFETLFGGGIGGLADVFKGLVWLMNPRSWLRMVEFLTGALMMLFGVIGLAVMFLQRSETVGKAANVAAALPGPVGGAGRAVTTVRAVGRGRGAAPRPRPRARPSEDEQLNQEQLARERYERQNRAALRRRQRIETARASRANVTRERDRGIRIRAGRDQISDDDIPF